MRAAPLACLACLTATPALAQPGDACVVWEGPEVRLSMPGVHPRHHGEVAWVGEGWVGVWRVTPGDGVGVLRPLAPTLRPRGPGREVPGVNGPATQTALVAGPDRAELVWIDADGKAWWRQVAADASLLGAPRELVAPDVEAEAREVLSVVAGSGPIVAWSIAEGPVRWAAIELGDPPTTVELPELPEGAAPTSLAVGRTPSAWWAAWTLDGTPGVQLAWTDDDVWQAPVALASLDAGRWALDASADRLGWTSLHDGVATVAVWPADPAATPTPLALGPATTRPALALGETSAIAWSRIDRDDEEVVLSAIGPDGALCAPVPVHPRSVGPDTQPTVALHGAQGVVVWTRTPPGEPSAVWGRPFRLTVSPAAAAEAPAAP